MASLMEQRYPRVSRCSGRRACCRILSPGCEIDKTTMCWVPATWKSMASLIVCLPFALQYDRNLL